MSWTSMFKWASMYLNILVHDMINLLYYEYWTDKQKYLYVYVVMKFVLDEKMLSLHSNGIVSRNSTYINKTVRNIRT